MSVFVWFLSAAMAAEIGGVQIPDTATVGGAPVVLNGVGLREKLSIDVYAGALYLPERTQSAEQAIAADVPKRISMTFLYDQGVRKDQLVDQFEESFGKQGNVAQAERQQLYGWLSDVKKGDVIQFDYVPGTGTTVTVRGEAKGTLPGKDFMSAVWTMYLGDNPPTPALKRGMLGNVKA